MSAAAQVCLALCLVCLVGAPVAHAHFANGYECGVNHPHVQEHIDAMPNEVVAQQYHVKEPLGRDLAQTYSTAAGGAFLPIAQAHTAGLTAPLRVKVLWDVVEGTDYSGSNAGTNARQCTAVGQTIRVRCQSGSSTCTEPWVNGCTADDVVAVGHPKLALMKKRVTWVTDFLANALTVKPVQDNIEISSSVVNEYQLSSSTVTNADLVVIMTARPIPHQKLAGFAFCVQRDQHQRCTVGVFNWVPAVLSVADQELPASTSSDRHTALHEVIHVLGGIFPNGPFIDDNGLTKSTGVYVVERDSIGYNKPATKIVTARALKVARDQFGCSSMTGVPIEDQPTGKGAHWEARLFGPEVMSYGSGVGEVYLSDLTLAYLEDTNQYIANYSFTGPLVQTSGDTSEDTDFDVDSTEVAVQEFSPGYLRWGRQEGCGFVQGNAKDWGDRYFCKSHREYTCSYDNRMAAVCDIRSGWQLSSQYTCGTYQPGVGTRCDVKLNDNCDSNNGCRLPSLLQHFTSATASAAFGGAVVNPGSTGGYSSAMDFVPVKIGYWSCANTKPAGNTSQQLAQEGGDVDLGTLTQGTEEQMRLFGGQAYCPTCRCFVSSLMEFSSGKVDPNFPRFGLCYRSNCFRKDYLQFAIQDQIGGDVTWYKCPSGGGKLYIAGFSGAFHCPKAVEFCRFETVSGIKYDETEPIWEWIVSSLFFTVPILIVLCCLCCGNKVAEKVKTAIGVHFFENPSDNDHLGREIPPECPSRMLQSINLCSGMFGITLMLLTLYGISTGRVSAAASTLLSFASFVIFMSCLGFCGATRRAKGASCVLLTYFYFVMFCSAGYMFFACWAWIYTEAFDKYVSRHWDTLVDTLPADLLSKQIDTDAARGTVQDNQLVAGIVALVILLMLAIAITGSVMIISMPVRARACCFARVVSCAARRKLTWVGVAACQVLMASLFMVANYSFVMTGVVIMGVGAYSTVFVAGFDTNLNILVGLFVCLGLYITLNALIGIIGAFQRSLVLLKVCLTMSLFSFVLQVSAAVILFVNSEAMGSIVDSLSDEDAARFTQNLGMTGLSKEEVRDSLQNNVRSLAVASLCWIATLIVSIVTNIYFIAAIRRERRQARLVGNFDAHRITPTMLYDDGYPVKDRRPSPAWEHGGGRAV